MPDVGAVAYGAVTSNAANNYNISGAGSGGGFFDGFWGAISSLGIKASEIGASLYIQSEQQKYAAKVAEYNRTLSGQSAFGLSMPVIIIGTVALIVVMIIAKD